MGESVKKKKEQNRIIEPCLQMMTVLSVPTMKTRDRNQRGEDFFALTILSGGWEMPSKLRLITVPGSGLNHWPFRAWKLDREKLPLMCQAQRNVRLWENIWL